MVDKNKYKFYISRKVDGSWDSAVSIEEYFDGLRYLKCTGLSDYGKIKNIYTESYAETDELRVYFPETVARENTEIELRLMFTGDDRRDVYDSFLTYISGCRIKFWDDCRNREVEMILVEAVTLSDDILIGGEPYIIVSFNFTNCNGQSKKHI